MCKICYIVVLDRVVKYFVYPHINAMIQDGNEITLVSPFTDAEALDNINGSIKKVKVEISRTVNPVNLVKNIFFFVRLFKSEKFDVIQYTGPSTSLICSLAGKIAHIRVRQYCMWGIRYEGFQNKFLRSAFKILEKITCLLSTNVLFDSENNRRFAIEEKLLSEKKSFTIGSGSACGVDLATYDISKKLEYRNRIRERYGIDKSDFVFGYVGRLSKEKGINELLVASKLITEMYSDVKILIVGFQEDGTGIDAHLTNWAKESNQVIFCGRIDLPVEYYASFDTFVFPSHREGFGGGCIQAGTFAVPSIVADIRSLMDAIGYGEYGSYYQCGNAERLAEKMNQFYLDRELVAKYGRKICMRVQSDFEMVKWQEQYKKHMNNIIGSMK